MLATGGRVSLTSLSTATSAQSVAASQVATSGKQSLTLAPNGTASGGTVYANSFTGNFVVPQNVQAILDFSNGKAMTVGNFVNNGTVYCVSSVPNVTNAAINVQSFLNGPNAQISTALGLSINSKTTFVNMGNITASGDLAVSAATSIANLGTMRSQNGNVGLAGTTAAFEIGNSGQIYAQNGVITIDQRAKTPNNFEINGGQWTAKTININAPNSKVHFVANDISAQVNVAAKELKIGAVWNPVNLGSTPVNTTIISAPPPEALAVSEASSRFCDADYIVDTDTD
jgi:hypothetical protein